MRFTSPLQLTPDASASLTKLRLRMLHSRQTIGAKVGAAVQAFKSTTVEIPITDRSDPPQSTPVVNF